MNGREVGGRHWHRRYTVSSVKVFFLVVIAGAALILSAIGVSSCSRSAKSAHSASSGGAKSPIGESGTEPQNELTAASDPAIVSLLMEELERQLAALPQGHNPTPEGYGRPRAVGYEADYSGMFSEEQPEFEPTASIWLIEGTIGDYDGNGEVGISDITPIALNYKQTVEYIPLEADEARPDWNGVRTPAGDPRTPEGAENWRLAQIDGDGNGEIGISDVTPIAQHYLAKLEGWRLNLVTYQDGRVVSPILPDEGDVWERIVEGGAARPFTLEIALSADYLPAVDAIGYMEDGFPGAFTFESAPVFARSEPSFGEIEPGDLYANVSCPNPEGFPNGKYLIRVPLSVLQFDTKNCPAVCTLSTGPKFDPSLSQGLISGMNFEAADAVPNNPLVPFELGITVIRDFDYEPKLEMFENLDGNWSSALKYKGHDFILEGNPYAIAPMPTLSPEDTWWRAEFEFSELGTHTYSQIRYMRGSIQDNALLLKQPYQRNEHSEIHTFVTSVPLDSDHTKRMRVALAEYLEHSDIRISQTTSPEVHMDGDSICLTADIATFFSQMIYKISFNIRPLDTGSFHLNEGYLYFDGLLNQDLLYDSSNPMWITRKARIENNYPLFNYDPIFIQYGQAVTFEPEGLKRVHGYYADGNIVLNTLTPFSGLRQGILEENGQIYNVSGTFPLWNPAGQPNSGNYSPLYLSACLESNNGNDWAVYSSFSETYDNSIYNMIINNTEMYASFVPSTDVKDIIPEMSFWYDDTSRLGFVDFDSIPIEWRYTPSACTTKGDIEYDLLRWGIDSYYESGKRFVVPAATGIESLRLDYWDRLNDSFYGGTYFQDIELNMASSEPPNVESAIDVEIGSEYSGVLHMDSRALIHAVNSDGRSRLKLSFRVPRESVMWFWKSGESEPVPFGWSYDGAIYQEYGTAMPEGFYIEICALPELSSPEGEPFTITVKDD